MNVRKGMARLARATAIAYWIVCAAIWVFEYRSWSEHDFGKAPLAHVLQDVLIPQVILYVVAWAAFRGLRWVALGFMDREKGAKE